MSVREIKINQPLSVANTNEGGHALYHQREPEWKSRWKCEAEATCMDFTPKDQVPMLVYPIANGFVKYIQEDNEKKTSAGNFIRIRHYIEVDGDDDDVVVLDSLYSHLKERPNFAYQQFVYFHRPIGRIGNTGGVGIEDMSTHLHMEIHYIPFPQNSESTCGRTPLPIGPLLDTTLGFVMDTYPELFRHTPLGKYL
jgi:murein DD-endopeptidase MepM/ murein hydrolase activator NlpD